MIKIYTLLRYDYDPDGDLALGECLGSFKTKELAEEYRDKDIESYHWSCHMNKDRYEIEEGVLIEKIDEEN